MDVVVLKGLPVSQERLCLCFPVWESMVNFSDFHYSGFPTTTTTDIFHCISYPLTFSPPYSHIMDNMHVHTMHCMGFDVQAV